MIASLSGKITHIDDRFIILDVGGVGYKIFITDEALHSAKKGADASYWTHLAVREDAMDLYGFQNKKEKDFFELLIGISGIGPKSALNVMSLVSLEQLASAVRTGSIAHLVKVSGIGRKTAEKIVLELRDKLGSLEDSEISADMASDMDAIEALKALGYDAEDSREALKKVDKSISDTSAKVKAALKVLS